MAWVPRFSAATPWGQDIPRALNGPGSGDTHSDRQDRSPESRPTHQKTGNPSRHLPVVGPQISRPIPATLSSLESTISVISEIDSKQSLRRRMRSWDPNRTNSTSDHRIPLRMGLSEFLDPTGENAGRSNVGSIPNAFYRCGEVGCGQCKCRTGME